MSLVNQWSEVIPLVMAELTDHERNALELSLDREGLPIGAKSLNTYGFDDITQYILCLESAKEKAKEFLRFEMDITSVQDLDLDLPQVTHEAVMIRRNKPAAPQNRSTRQPLSEETKKRYSEAAKKRYKEKPDTFKKVLRPARTKLIGWSATGENNAV